jgi:hypothetical protein
VLLNFLDLPVGQSHFRYRVETRTRSQSFFASAMDHVPGLDAGGHPQWLEYDVLNTPIAPINTSLSILATRPMFLDVEGGSITSAVNTAILATRPATRMLVLHMHNPPSAQAELVAVRSPTTFVDGRSSQWRSYLPFVGGKR